MKKHLELQEAYTDLLNEVPDPELINLIQRLDALTNVPQPPANLSWTTMTALYNKETANKQIPINNTHDLSSAASSEMQDHRPSLQLVPSIEVLPNFIKDKQRKRRRYGIGLTAAVLVIGFLISSLLFAANHNVGNVPAGIRMQLAVVENGSVPSQATLEKTLTILSERFSRFGLKGSSVSLAQKDGQSTINVALPFFEGNQQQAIDKLIIPGTVDFWDTGPDGVLAPGTNFNPNDYTQYNPGGQARFTNRDLNPGSLSVVQDPIIHTYGINFTIQDTAISRFQDFTANNIGHGLTITLDGTVLMSATIQAKISGSGTITSSFTLQQTNALVATLKSGVLPVGLKRLV